MVITQSITIPADHRLTIDVPPEVPAGPMVISFAPVGTNPQGTPVLFGCAKGQFLMAEDFDTLPTEYIGEVIDFVGYLRQKTRRSAFAEQKTSENNDKIRLTRKELDKMLQDCPHTLALSGILSGVGDVDLDEIRMERLAKHL